MTYVPVNFFTQYVDYSVSFGFVFSAWIDLNGYTYSPYILNSSPAYEITIIENTIFTYNYASGLIGYNISNTTIGSSKTITQ